jgi:hypothetical protein
MQENGLVMAYQFTCSTSPSEVAPMVESMAARYPEERDKQPNLAYVDSAATAGSLSSVFKDPPMGLKEDPMHVMSRWTRILQGWELQGKGHV